MIETEWLTTADHRAMLDHIAGRSPWKLRRFACEFWRRFYPHEPGEEAVAEVYQRHLAGAATAAEWFKASSAAGRARLGKGLRYVISPDPLAAVRRLLGVPRGLSRFAHKPGRAADPELSSLLREIYGNPFRPVSFAPAWRTDTAVILASGIDAARDFSPMPILADALQDAECDHADVLTHCREGVAGGDRPPASRPHARGCWVVDLVLGKA